MSRKILTLILSLSLVSFLFVGCSGRNLTNSEDSVVVAVWDGTVVEFAQSYFDNVADLDFKVEVTSIDWDEYWVAVDNAINTGNGVDIFLMHTNRFETYKDKLMPVNSILTAEKRSAFENDLLGQFSVSGDIYAIPYSVSSIGLYYNKKLFDNAGLTYPNDSWTWDDLVKAAKALTNKDEGVYGFLAECWGEDGYYNTIFQNNGYIYSPATDSWGYDNVATQEGIQYYLDFITTHNVSPATEDILDIDTSDMFASGKVAMIFRGSWELSSFTDNDEFRDSFDVAELPSGKIKACTSNATGFVTSLNNKNNDNIIRVLESLSSDDFYETLAHSGTEIPCNINYRSQWAGTYSSSYHASELIDMLDYGVYMPTITGIENWSEPEEEILLDIFLGNTSVSEGCRKLNETYSEKKK